MFVNCSGGFSAYVVTTLFTILVVLQLRRRLLDKLVLLLTTCVVTTILYMGTEVFTALHHHIYGRRDKLELCMIVCGDGAVGVEKEQLELALVAIKSAVLNTQSSIHVTLLVDRVGTSHEEGVGTRLRDRVKRWHHRYRRKLSIDIGQLTYPPHLLHLRDMGGKGRRCGTGRFLLPHLFPHLDALLYLDTDVVFLQPPEKLWQEFDKFDEQNILGLAPCLHIYGTNKTSVAFPGSSGVNGGVMLMNLTRISRMKPPLLDQLVSVADQNMDKIVYGDQDIVNIFLHKEKKSLHSLPCYWNYRKGVCQYRGRNRCEEAESAGIHLLHGSGHSFVDNRVSQFRAVFEMFRDYDIGGDGDMFTDRNNIKNMIESRLNNDSLLGLPSICGTKGVLDHMIVKGIEESFL